MNRSTRKAQFVRAGALGLFVAVAAFGCSKRAARTSVSGRVTFDGQPVAAGQIVLEPLGSGRMGVAQIADGAYQMPAEHGPTAGEYIVRITANRGAGRMVPSGARGTGQAPVEAQEQYIPAKYNDRSELKTQVGQEAEVVRDFELTSK